MSKDNREYVVFTSEARNFRFICVRKPSLLNEYVMGPLTVKHLLALMVAIFLFGLGGSVSWLNYVCITIALFVLACAFYPAKAMSLETTLFAIIMTLIDMIVYNKEKKEVREIILEREEGSEREDLSKLTDLKVDFTLLDSLSMGECRKMTIEEILSYKPISKRK